MDKVTKSDDQWTELLGKLEKMQEDTSSAISAADESTKEEMRFMKEALDSTVERVAHFEDKINNPDQREYFGKYDVSETKTQRQALCSWLQDAYRSRFSPSGQYDLSEFTAQRAVPTQTEGSATEGGNTVPSPLDTEIHRIRNAAGVARRICRTIPMTSDTLDLPTITTDPTVVFAGENTEPSNAGVVFGQEQLVAKKLIALDQISSELAEDSAVELFSVLVELFGEAIALKEDNEIFQGTGSNFSGLLSKCGASVVPATASFAGIGYDDIVNLMHSVDDNLVFEGTFVFHPEILKQLRLIKDGNDNPIWQPGMTAAAPATILGRPYELANQMPGTDGSAVDAVLYGVPSRYGIIGDRRGLDVKFSEEHGFNTDSRYLRVIERLAFVVTKTTAFAKITTS
jgi:HK97 family phage major capsid protein